MTSAPRILILTAAFGEGHNSAARNLALALQSAGAVATVHDPCLLATPRLTALVNRGYRLVTSRFPRFWKTVYQSTAKHDWGQTGSPLMRKVGNVLVSLIQEHKPDAIVSTYPLYPYFLPHLLEEQGSRARSFTVVTDSIEINAAWQRFQCDGWLVTDAHTRDALVREGMSAEKIVETGFPVHPNFATLSNVPGDDACDPFRILYFPTPNGASLYDQAAAMLEASDKTTLTMVLGRNVRPLYRRAREIKDAFPGRVRIIGWTRKIPILLTRHHLVVGKAGGATVHEAIAACCPMLIHHLVPGQEEGNLKLLEIIGAGSLADNPASLSRAVTEMLGDRASKWRSMKSALSRHGRNAGAITAAKYVLGAVGEHRTSNV